MSNKHVEGNFAMLHILRNPFGWSDDVVREVRNKAADELERLWALEREVKMIGKELLEKMR